MATRVSTEIGSSGPISRSCTFTVNQPDRSAPVTHLDFETARCPRRRLAGSTPGAPGLIRCRMRDMTQEAVVHHGLEGVVAFETEIAEPDKEGSALRYRGVDIEEIVGRVPFEKVWGLLIDGAYEPGLPPAEPYNIPIHTGDVRADVQAGVAMLAPQLGMRQTYDISDKQARLDLSRVAVMVLSYAAQAARGLGLPIVPQREVDQ